MRLDHVSFAAGPKGLDKTVVELSERLGTDFVYGGVHPSSGTRNFTLPLSGGHYLEVVEALDHPAADQAPFGQAVRDRSEMGGGWLGWVVAVDDLDPVEQRLGRKRVEGRRVRPDSSELSWQQVGVKGLLNDPQLPFFIQWVSEPDERPMARPSYVSIKRLSIAGDPGRVAKWLDAPVACPFDDLEVEWVAPAGQPGIVSVTFATPSGPVTV